MFFYNNANADLMNIYRDVLRTRAVISIIIINLSKILNVLIFADDSNVFCTSKDIVSLAQV